MSGLITSILFRRKSPPIKFHLPGAPKEDLNAFFSREADRIRRQYHLDSVDVVTQAQVVGKFGQNISGIYFSEDGQRRIWVRENADVHYRLEVLYHESGHALHNLLCGFEATLDHFRRSEILAFTTALQEAYDRNLCGVLKSGVLTVLACEKIKDETPFKCVDYNKKVVEDAAKFVMRTKLWQKCLEKLKKGC
jgi:hypothetical protein